MTDHELTKSETLFLAKHELTREYYKIMRKASFSNLPPEVRGYCANTNLNLHDALMLYFREYRVKKSSQVIAELKAENARLKKALMAFVPASQWDNFWKLMQDGDA